MGGALIIEFRSFLVSLTSFLNLDNKLNPDCKTLDQPQTKGERMSKDIRVGGAVLLQDEHFGMQNPWSQPVVGWVENSQGVGGLHNPYGFAMPRIVLQKLIDGAMRPLYDQPVIIENAGSIVIPQLGERVGLVRNFRMVGERLLSEAGANYIKELQAQNLWDKLIESLGAWRWECPRGLIPPDVQQTNGESLIDFVVRTAKLEALEEAGFRIEEARIVGRVNTNPTFFPHPQYIVHARIVSIGNASPENLEIIGERKLFTMEELRALNDVGEFDDGLTLAALALCGLSL